MDDMDEALKQFDDKLNLTAGEDDIQAQIGDNLEKEYNKFMEDIQNDQTD